MVFQKFKFLIHPLSKKIIMKTHLRFYVILFILLTIPMTSAFAVIQLSNCNPDCYVDSEFGNDGNDGVTWGTAKLTITAALVLADTSGDVVHVKSGTYNLGGGSLLMSSLGVDGVTLRSDDGFGNLDPENTIIESSAAFSWSLSGTIQGFVNGIPFS